MKFYDLTLPLSPNTPEWPGDTKYQRNERKTTAIVSKLTMSTHFGTHLDAPKHFIFNKTSVDKLPLANLLGEFKVFQLKSRQLISLSDIKNLNIKPGDRVIFKTRNSKIINLKNFTSNYLSLSLEAAKFLANKKIALVGIDYFGIETKAAPGHPVHKALLAKNIVIVEGLNLSAIKPGVYQGAVLPLKIEGGDGSPARAVLWK